MAAIHDVSLPPALDSLRELVAGALWTWIDEHKDTEVFKVKIWIFTKTFRVSDLEPFAELLLGAHP